MFVGEYLYPQLCVLLLYSMYTTILIFLYVINYGIERINLQIRKILYPILTFFHGKIQDIFQLHPVDFHIVASQFLEEFPDFLGIAVLFRLVVNLNEIQK